MQCHNVTVLSPLHFVLICVDIIRFYFKMRFCFKEWNKVLEVKWKKILDDHCNLTFEHIDSDMFHL